MQTGKLFTGRIYDAEKIRAKDPKAGLICIMRFPPYRFVDFKKHDIIVLQEFAPSKELHKRYKQEREENASLIAHDKNIEESIWQTFMMTFMGELLSYREIVEEARLMIVEALREGQDIYLLCQEEPDQHCHRKLIYGYIAGAFSPEVRSEMLGGEVKIKA